MNLMNKDRVLKVYAIFSYALLSATESIILMYFN